MQSRYYSATDPFDGVTPRELKAYPRSRQKPYLVYWFLENFGDPKIYAQYSPQEMGYLYPYSGPHDAFEELSEEFSSIVEEFLIRETATELENGSGVGDWAPTPYRVISDQFQQRKLRGFGSERELDRRRLIKDDLVRLRAVLARPPSEIAAIGHNNPPEDISDRLIEADNIAAMLQENLEEDKPDAGKAIEDARWLERFAKWVSNIFSMAKDEIVKTIIRKTVEYTYENLNNIGWIVYRAYKVAIDIFRWLL